MQIFTQSTSLLGTLVQTRNLANTKLTRQFLTRFFVPAQVRPIVHMAGEHDNLESASDDSSSSVYVQHSKGNDMITISFEYELDSKKKSFNLYRKADEPLSAAFERLKLNLSKLNKIKKTKAKPLDEDQDAFFSLRITQNGAQVDPAQTKNADAWIEGAVMEINDKPFVIKRNEPQVVIMKLPSTIMRGFITVPSVDLANCDIHTCKFSWYRQISAIEKDKNLAADSSTKLEFDNRYYWLYLSTGITYSPTDHDVAHNLKVVCRPSDGTKVGPTHSCFGNRPVELGPPFCPFEKRHFLTKDRLQSDQLRFVSYNILANLYADSDYSRKNLFAHCPAHALEIDYRRQLILKEIHGYNADIVCLQEVDRREYNKTYEPYFKLVSGHQGVFDTKGGQVAEGVATFFRDDRFELIDSHKTILSRLIDPTVEVERDSGLDEEIPLQDNTEDKAKACDDLIKISHSVPHPILDDLESKLAKDLLARMNTIRDAIHRNEALTKRFMGRHTVVQTNLFKLRDLRNKYVIVANTHLYFAPDADHIRLLQGSVCVRYMEFLRDYYRTLITTRFGDDQPSISILFCGDMNSTPDCGLFKLVHEGKIDDKLPDWRSNDKETVEGLSIETDLRLSSAYQDIPYTNYTPGFKGCLDYIYYESSGIECKSIVPLPDHEDVIATGGIPSDVFPSDHLALVANLKIKE